MGKFKFGERSKARMVGLHPDLVKVMNRALEISDIDFTVIEGLRTLARQKQLVASGASKTLNSRHLSGHAIDIAPLVDGEIRWDWPLFFPVAKAVQKAAEELKIPVRWGGTWKLLSATPVLKPSTLSRSFPDGPHFELWSGKYP